MDRRPDLSSAELVARIRRQTVNVTTTSDEVPLDMLMSELEFRLRNFHDNYVPKSLRTPCPRCSGEHDPAYPCPPSTSGGANRHPVPVDLSQLSDVALRIVGKTQVEGNNRYGAGNWRKGLQVSNLLTHALVHILALQNGRTADGSEFDWEVELGHALWNLEKVAHFIETRPDLIDIKPLAEAIDFRKKLV